HRGARRGGVAGGVQRAGCEAGFDDEHAFDGVGEDAVAAREVAAARALARWCLADERATSADDLLGEAGVARGVDRVEAAGEDRDRRGAGFEARAVRGGVDADREAAPDDRARTRERAAEVRGRGEAVGRRGAAADDRDRTALAGERREVAA